ncbi:MAG TPA: hypothetical protein VGD02_00350 [Gemmatimonadaceae bacterium]
MSPFTVVHITGGAVGIVSGFTALFVGKGSTLHRWSGRVFVGAMLTMALTGGGIAIVKGQTGNIFGGMLALYMVVTALTTVRPMSRWVDIATMLLGTALGTWSLTLGGMAVAAGKSTAADLPVPMVLIVFGIIPLLAAFGDWRVMRAGGIHGRPRLTRHLWRMNLSLWIAAASFFTIRRRVAMILPEPFLSLPVRMIPFLLPLLAIVYWVWRLRYRKNYRSVKITRDKLFDGFRTAKDV